MKEVVYEPEGEMIAWAESRIPGCKFRDDAHAIGIRSEAGLHGVVVFDSFTTAGCWISVASDGGRRWLTRELLIRVFAYPFLQCGHPRINAFISAGNQASLALCEGLGFVREGVMRQAGFNGEDLIMLGMLRSECSWLPHRVAGKTGRTQVYTECRA